MTILCCYTDVRYKNVETYFLINVLYLNSYIFNEWMQYRMMIKMIRLLENRKHIFRLTLHFDLIASSLNVVINHERSIMSESWRHQNVWGIKLISLHCY